MFNHCCNKTEPKAFVNSPARLKVSSKGSEADRTAKKLQTKVSSSLVWWVLGNKIVDNLRHLLAL